MTVLNDLEEYIRTLSWIQGTRSSINGTCAYALVTSIKGYIHALIIADSCSEHRLQYGMKTKDEVLAMSKRWIAETAGIQKNNPILYVVRDNVGENTSKELNDYFTERGIKNFFSTPYEQWQHGLAEASVNSVTMLGRTVMAEFGLGGQFWFSATMHDVNCRNATYKERPGTSPHEKVYGKKKDVSWFRPFGCRGYMHQNKEQRAKGRGVPRALKVLNLGLATDCNTSGYKFLIQETGKILISNKVRLDKTFFPRRNRQMIDDHLTNIAKIDVVSLDRGA